MTVPAVFPSIPAGTGHLPSPHAGFFRAGEAIFRPLSIKNNAGPERTRPSKSSPPSSSVSLPLFQILPGAANGPFHFPELEKKNHAEQIQLLRRAVDDTHPSRPPQRPSPPKGITPPILLPVNAVYDFSPLLHFGKQFFPRTKNRSKALQQLPAQFQPRLLAFFNWLFISSSLFSKAAAVRMSANRNALLTAQIF